jgi:cobalt-zinc-cadmium efflux system outer membrane protein
MHYLHCKTAVIICLPVMLIACATAKADQPWPEPRPLGSSIPTFFAPAQPPAIENQQRTIEAPSETITIDDALKRALMHNPDVARWETEVEQRKAALEVARADRIPDLTLGAGIKYLNESDDETYLMALSLPIPFFNRNQGGVLEASYAVSRTKEESADAVVRVTTEVHETYQNLLSAFDEVSTLRTIVLPGAHTSFNAAREGYREGKFSYLIVLDAQRTLIETEQEHVNALVDYHKSKSALERLIAKEL